MSIKSFFIAQGLVLFLNNKENKQKIKELADHIDKEADAFFGNQSENIQKNMVSNILFPLCRELLKEDSKTYLELLSKELLLVD